MKSEERKAWEREQRKERIIDIAEGVFFKKGMDNATIEEIAEAAGYNKRTLYLYFADKEDIFLAVVFRALKIFKSKLETAYNTSGESGIAIRNIGKAFFDYSIEYPDYFSVFMTYESRIFVYYEEPEQQDDDSFRSLCRKLSIEYGDIVLKSIEQDIKNKKINTTLEPMQLMLLLWGQVNGVMQIILMRKYKFQESFGISTEELYAHFMGMVENSLKFEV
ncbi:MAG: TetR/AcrR family transcriptional regulator [bacterium]|nr:TetR/AcrR family transcriptional regulator [bacterium]